MGQPLMWASRKQEDSPPVSKISERPTPGTTMLTGSERGVWLMIRKPIS
jgi:hypothetical protein